MQITISPDPLKFEIFRKEITKKAGSNWAIMPGPLLTTQHGKMVLYSNSRLYSFETEVYYLTNHNHNNFLFSVYNLKDNLPGKTFLINHNDYIKN